MSSHDGAPSPTSSDGVSFAGADASPTAAVSDGAGDLVSSDRRGRACGWCGLPIPYAGPGTYCGQRCRQSAFRLRRRRGRVATPGELIKPARFAYADPPYIGRARKYYGGEATYGGEVDHDALIERLEAGAYEGWALSCATDTLDVLLPMLKRRGIPYRIGTWVKPGAAPERTFGVHNMQEQLLVARGRRLQPGVRDWLLAQPARFGGDLMGRKPIAFCSWLFDMLGMVPGDELDDLFPGTGIVGRCWNALRLVPAGVDDEGRRVLLSSLHVDDGEGASAPADDAGVVAVVVSSCDACEHCGEVLEPGRFGGGCEDCDLLLCPSCEKAHGPERCGGVRRSAEEALLDR